TYSQASDYDLMRYATRVTLELARLGASTPPREIRNNLSPELEAICLKCMAARPQDRYSSATEVASEVERWLAEGRVHGYRYRPIESLRRKAKLYSNWI